MFRMNECLVSLVLSVFQVFDPVQETISCLCVRSSIQLRHALFYLCNSHGGSNSVLCTNFDERDSFFEIDCNYNMKKKSFCTDCWRECKFFIFIKIKLIFTGKVVHLASF